LPDVSTPTFTPTLTFPVIVSRDLRETGGRNCSVTEPGIFAEGAFAIGDDAEECGDTVPLFATSDFTECFDALASEGVTSGRFLALSVGPGFSIVVSVRGMLCESWFEYLDPARTATTMIPAVAAAMPYRSEGFFFGGSDAGSKRAAISGTVHRR